MAYKKYIKRNGKIYGPYTYHSKRVNGKVVSEYVGSSNEVREFNYSNLKYVFLLMGVFLILILGFFFVKNIGTFSSGQAVLGLDADYVPGEALEGALRLSLESGEFIPADSKLIIEGEGNSYEFLLKDVLIEEASDGEFYAKGVDISGGGLGYGLKGEKEVYPKVYFDLEIYEKEKVSGGSGSNGGGSSGGSEGVILEGDLNSDVSDDSIVGDVSNGVEEESVVEGEEDVIDESLDESLSVGEEDVIFEESSPTEESNILESNGESQTDVSASEEVSEESVTESIVEVVTDTISAVFLSMTGRVSMKLDSEVAGEVTKEELFRYSLNEGEDVKIKTSSVRTDKRNLGKDVLDLEVDSGEVIVRTDYSEFEDGYGEDYEGEFNLELVIDLSNLDLMFDPGKVSVKLVYGEKEIVYLETILEEGSVQGEGDIVNESAKDEIDINKSEEILNSSEVFDDYLFSNLSLSEDEEKIFFENFGNSSVLITRSQKIGDRIIIRFELGKYWVEYSYDALSSDLERLIENDKILWIKDILKELTKEEIVPQDIDLNLSFI